jgi:hypothetical protein
VAFAIPKPTVTELRRREPGSVVKGDATQNGSIVETSIIFAFVREETMRSARAAGASEHKVRIRAALRKQLDIQPEKIPKLRGSSKPNRA